MIFLHSFIFVFFGNSWSGLRTFSVGRWVCSACRTWAFAALSHLRCWRRRRCHTFCRTGFFPACHLVTSCRPSRSVECQEGKGGGRNRTIIGKKIFLHFLPVCPSIWLSVRSSIVTYWLLETGNNDRLCVTFARNPFPLPNLQGHRSFFQLFFFGIRQQLELLPTPQGPSAQIFSRPVFP